MRFWVIKTPLTLLQKQREIASWHTVEFSHMPLCLIPGEILAHSDARADKVCAGFPGELINVVVAFGNCQSSLIRRTVGVCAGDVESSDAADYVTGGNGFFRPDRVHAPFAPRSVKRIVRVDFKDDRTAASSDLCFSRQRN